ncbi:hypothetical protein JHK82_050124 [Glycine max]|uniref:Uncharacterized protein n=2 Tax=Glycine subgen. Soja TaxID=1462606 RepID=A0A0R0F7V0_SOYBN|nr:hypothetical protein JHK86_049995 [Glycine max]KAG4924257.1 hypothetical protein JHK87_049797 [Glycine soja]KAG4935855.1 hypothetical protein JHK85_050774 [Glycine max]KAG5091346.1 hypothetical protein JHK82_050124 [Glycine max]KAG5094458.1 hypothetical protein JHK84_050046 [Glycine max]
MMVRSVMIGLKLKVSYENSNSYICRISSMVGRDMETPGNPAFVVARPVESFEVPNKYRWRKHLHDGAHIAKGF